jgi:ABC-type Zn uptake system ZnuABC Zn-binding protein ZnuA
MKITIGSLVMILILVVIEKSYGMEIAFVSFLAMTILASFVMMFMITKNIGKGPHYRK